MEFTTDKTKRSFKQGLIHRLHDPFQLKAAVCVVLLAVWYWLGYAPMSDRIALTTANLERDRKRLALVTEIQALREEAVRFAERLPPRSDPNEFVQYVLDGVRAGPLQLVSLSPGTPRDAGPYEVATVKIELEGKYKDFDAFFRWVENDKRLLRVDDLRASPDTKDPGLVKVQLSVLGLMGVEEKVKTDPKAEPPKAVPKEVAPRGKASTKTPIRGSGSPGSPIEKAEKSVRPAP